MSGNNNTGAEEGPYWQRRIGEAARSGVSFREFCRQRRLRESQFYWWQCGLEEMRQQGALPNNHGAPGGGRQGSHWSARSRRPRRAGPGSSCH